MPNWAEIRWLKDIKLIKYIAGQFLFNFLHNLYKVAILLEDKQSIEVWFLCSVMQMMFQNVKKILHLINWWLYYFNHTHITSATLYDWIKISFLFDYLLIFNNLFIWIFVKSIHFFLFNLLIKEFLHFYIHLL